MNTNPMAVALRFLNTGPAMIKLRQKTSQPMTFTSGKLKEERTTIVEEHIEVIAQSWAEIGETGVFRLSLSPATEMLLAAEDIFMVLAKPAGIT